MLLLPGTWQLESILVQVSSSTSIWVSSTPLIHIIYIYIEASSHSCCWSKLMEEGEKSQLIFGRNVAGNNFMHAKTELSEEGSLFSARAHVYLRWQSARKSSSKHTHSILLVWILLKYKLNILPSINFGVWIFRIILITARILGYDY